MNDNIRNVYDHKNSVWAEYVYQLRYDKRTKRFSCTCEAFMWKTPCHHIREFREMLKK